MSEAYDLMLPSEDADEMCRLILSITSSTEDELEEALAFPGVFPATVCESEVSEERLASSDVILCVDVRTADNLLNVLGQGKSSGPQEGFSL